MNLECMDRPECFRVLATFIPGYARDHDVYDRWCGYCRAAKQLLEREELPYDEISVDDDPHFRQRMHELSGRSNSAPT